MHNHSPLGDIPVFALYGETTQWPTPDLLHCESIAERSRLHDWHIRAHRHADLVHLLVLYEGEVELELEGSTRQTEAPLAIVVPPLCIHGFRFSPTIQGHILTLAAPLVDHLTKVLPEASRTWRRASVQPLPSGGASQRLMELVRHIDGEYRRPASGRDALLGALIQALTIEASRLAIGSSDNGSSDNGNSTTPHQRSRHHLRRFEALVEESFRHQPNIEELAAQLELSSAHLNSICRQQAGTSALALLHQRLLLEARRELTYTNLTIAQVSDGLGFSDPAYFTRFFKRLTGVSPSNFRKRQQRSPGHY